MLADANIRLAEAEAYITRAYKLKPDAVEIIDSMGWIAFRLNKLQKAEYYLRLALERQEIPEIIGHLVEVLRKKCETEEANAILKKGLNKFPTDEYLLTLNRPFTCPQTGATP